MMEPTEPANVKRPVVIRVVTLDLLNAADFAGLADQGAVLHCSVDGCAGANLEQATHAVTRLSVTPSHALTRVSLNRSSARSSRP